MSKQISNTSRIKRKFRGKYGMNSTFEKLLKIVAIALYALSYALCLAFVFIVCTGAVLLFIAGILSAAPM